MKTTEINKESVSILKNIKAVYKKYGIIGIIQFGSSLRHEEMFSNSDLDFIVITKNNVRNPWKIHIDSNTENNILVFSEKDFIRNLREGFPVVLVGMRFGKILYDPKRILITFKKYANPTPHTIETWYENGLSVYSVAIMEYFSVSCACCYLKDVHHSARSFLRAYLLKNKNILCEKDRDILDNLDGKNESIYKNIFRKLIEYRKKIDSFSYNEKRLLKTRTIKGKDGIPLILLENLMIRMTEDFEQKKIYTVNESINKIKERYDHVVSIYLSDKSEGKAKQRKYYISIALPSKKIQLRFKVFPFYKK